MASAASRTARPQGAWELLEEYRWEPDDVQPSLLQDEPPTTGDERWDVLLALPPFSAGAEILFLTC